ncbi:MAG: ribonuclease HII [Peptococcaceae bacterium]|nr:ribonuclease HII [Peptococcaceae bacterium]
MHHPRQLTVREIKIILEGPKTPDPNFLRLLAQDGRKGVQALYNRYMAKMLAQQKEKERLAALFKPEVELYCRGVRLVAGVDEAGRGPLAGPVVAAAVIFAEPVFIPGLNDSKRLSGTERLLVAKEIASKALDWGIGIVTAEEIGCLNIHQASLEAMRRAVGILRNCPQWVLVDGRFMIPGLDIKQTSIVKGDARSASIAGASILAKVFRDRVMEWNHLQFPTYGFDRHKGYPTPEHFAVLQKHGPCPLHRKGFNLRIARG